MFRVPSFLRSLVLAAALTLPWIASPAWADTAKISLKSGEVTQAEVLKLEFGKQVTVRMADGSEKTIPWSEIENLEMIEEASAATGQATAEGDKQHESEPEEATPAPVAPAPAAAAAPSSANLFQQLQMVEEEIDDLEEDRPGLGGPITLMAIGYPVGALFFVTGVNVSNFCYSECGALAAPYFAISGVSIAAAVVGTVWLVGNLGARSRIDNQIKAREEERDQLRWDLRTSSDGFYGSATVSF